MPLIRRTFILLGFALALASSGASHVAASCDDDDCANASAGLATRPPNDAVQGSFEERSYAPGAVATLTFRGRAQRLAVQVFRAGSGRDGALQGAAVSTARTLVRAGGSVRVAIGNWSSGLYYARIRTPGRGCWDAPFVLRPRHLGDQRVAIVLPTNTWQAYNYEDGDSWYFNANVHTVDLARPYLDGGVPPHYHGYDRGFIRWLVLHHAQADFFSDDDLDALASGRELARYRLVVFSGTRNTSRSTSSTSSRATATSAATSRSCRRTTSSTR
jgi:hypothetical protein